MAQPTLTKGHCGVCRCRKCGKTNPWRSDFEFSVAGLRTAVYPGFLGACRFCAARESQDVVLVTATLEEAVQAADLHPDTKAQT